MSPTIHIRLAPKTFIPVATVPLHAVWELAEYLACRRTRVQYSYKPRHCDVFFPNLDAPAAQQVLNDWVASTAAQPHAHGWQTWRSDDRQSSGTMTAARCSARAVGNRRGPADGDDRHLHGEPGHGPGG